MSELPEPEEHESPVVRDKRRFNPDGTAREATPEPAASAASTASTEPAVEEPAEPVEPTVPLADLQRLKAEYDNYRRRTERDREAVVEMATASVLGQLLPVLDDVERARAHGDLTGAFGAVGEALVAITAKLGLEAYGLAGDVFDPQLHDAVMAAAPQDGIETTVAAEVYRPGFRFGGRVLRPAQVAVAEPAEVPAAPVAEEGEQPG